MVEPDSGNLQRLTTDAAFDGGPVFVPAPVVEATAGLAVEHGADRER